MAFVLFGLTGGIACGKSTVATRFRELGIEVIDADQLARLAVAPGTSGLAEVAKAFGPDVLRDDGTLDRMKLAEVVFHDEDKRLKLNRILHPRIAARTACVSIVMDDCMSPLVSASRYATRRDV